jgi:hypothetical protein
MGTPRKTKTGVRTTVSLAEVVWEMAEEMMDTRGFNQNFSSYVADLIRRDKEREEARGKSSDYPPHRDQTALAEERPPKKKTA